jgi:hypothetical protein
MHAMTAGLAATRAIFSNPQLLACPGGMTRNPFLRRDHPDELPAVAAQGDCFQIRRE